MGFDCLIRNGLIVLPQEIIRADLGLVGGSIVEIGPQLAGAAVEEIDAIGLHVLAGVVDSHVHFNEPGRTDWEGAATGSAALAAGGGTCFCDMPLNSTPPTCTAAAFDLKRAALEQNSLLDFGIWGGLVRDNHEHLEALAERGVMGFKAFMCGSGIDDFSHVDEDALGRGMEIAVRLGLPVAVHAEDQQLTSQNTLAAIAAGKTSIRDYLNSRPIEAETKAISQAIALAAQTGCALHIVHISSGAGIREVVEARARGVNVTCETCPHYLVLTDEDVVRIGAAAKCSPPIRDHVQQEALWASIVNGELDFIASDHSPSPHAMKQSEDFFAIWGGIAGVQTTLGLVLQEGLQREVPLCKLSALLSANPAQRYGLAKKGRIEVGFDADLILVDLASSGTVRAEDLLYRHRLSPFLGKTLGGSVRKTILRGKTIFANGTIVAGSSGRFLPSASCRLQLERS